MSGVHVIEISGKGHGSLEAALAGIFGGSPFEEDAENAIGNNGNPLEILSKLLGANREQDTDPSETALAQELSKVSAADTVAFRLMAEVRQTKVRLLAEQNGGDIVAAIAAVDVPAEITNYKILVALEEATREIAVLREQLEQVTNERNSAQSELQSKNFALGRTTSSLERTHRYAIEIRSDLERTEEELSAANAAIIGLTPDVERGQLQTAKLTTAISLIEQTGYKRINANKVLSVLRQVADKDFTGSPTL